MGVNSTWASSLTDQEMGTISLESMNNGEWGANGGIEKHKFSSVWYRRAQFTENIHNARDCDRKYLHEEWSTLHRNICSVSGEILDGLWINKPFPSARAENKLLQLSAARNCGLAYPDTLVSNDPTKIRNFVRSYTSVIYKSFMPHTWYNNDSGISYALFARIIDESMVKVTVQTRPFFHPGFQPDNLSVDLHHRRFGHEGSGKQAGTPLGQRLARHFQAPAKQWLGSSSFLPARGDCAEHVLALEAAVVERTGARPE